ncbi:unnamed protein product [Owenia fusiformis]|uniref:Uncharacterized protein n=1 Tax=Owenia fusiformis TaxID=6347 RepID=A0A8S4P072_OWEFU|nr:unnamed protein product [Owenia fusiformis]
MPSSTMGLQPASGSSIIQRVRRQISNEKSLWGGLGTTIIKESDIMPRRNTGHYNDFGFKGGVARSASFDGTYESPYANPQHALKISGFTKREKRRQSGIPKLSATPGYDRTHSAHERRPSWSEDGSSDTSSLPGTESSDFDPAAGLHNGVVNGMYTSTPKRNGDDDTDCESLPESVASAPIMGNGCLEDIQEYGEIDKELEKVYQNMHRQYQKFFQISRLKSKPGVHCKCSGSKHSTNCNISFSLNSSLENGALSESENLPCNCRYDNLETEHHSNQNGGHSNRCSSHKCRLENSECSNYEHSSASHEDEEDYNKNNFISRIPTSTPTSHEQGGLLLLPVSFYSFCVSSNVKEAGIQ